MPGFSAETKTKVLERQNGCCDCCGRELKPYYSSGFTPNYHHRKPKSVGGSDTSRNCVALCPTCHNEIHTYLRKYPNKGYSEHKKYYKSSVRFKRN